MPTHPVTTTLLPITQVHPNPDQARKSFDLAEMEELKTSIKERGLINPISVKQQGDVDYLIISGERRFRACCDLGWTEIDARIWPSTTPPQEVELLSLVENLQRNDLKPIELAKAYKVLNEAPHNLNQEDIARQVGKSQTVVALIMGLLDQPKEIQDFISQEIISPTHMRFLGRIEDLKERIKWAKRAGEEGWNVKETEKRINEYLSGQPKGGDGGDKPAAKPAWKTSDIPSFAMKGDRVLIQASCDLTKDKPKAFLENLLAPMMEFLRKDEAGVCYVNQWIYEEKNIGEARQPSAGKGGKSLNLPKTPEEAAKLEELAAASPGPQAFYAQIYGENSPTAASMAGMRWADTPLRDPREFVRMFLKKHQNAPAPATSIPVAQRPVDPESTPPSIKISG